MLTLFVHWPGVPTGANCHIRDDSCLSVENFCLLIMGKLLY